jgi:hypothetical protein
MTRRREGRWIDQLSLMFWRGGGASVCGRLMGCGDAIYRRGMGDDDALQNSGSWEGELAAQERGIAAR